MPTRTLLCRVATPFTREGGLDENALRKQLARLASVNFGVYLGSGGSGEGFALSHEELSRLYRIGVKELKGKVCVYANPPEQHTARGAIEQTRIAHDAGIEVVNIYPLAGWHGMRPNDGELIAYYDEVLSNIRQPVALSVNPVTGYIPPASLISGVVRKYKQVEVVNLFGMTDIYLQNLRAEISKDIPVYVPVPGSLNAFALGATGLVGAAANIIPKTHRRYLDLIDKMNLSEIGPAYAEILRFSQYVSKWSPSNARWIKMVMRVLNMPGGAGGLREPYRMPPEAEMKAFAEGLLKLDLQEIKELQATYQDSP